MWHQCRQASCIGHDHRFFKMIGQGVTPLLCSVAIRLDNAIGCTHIVFHLAVGNEICAQDQHVAYVQLPDLVLVGLLVLFVKFTVPRVVWVGSLEWGGESLVAEPVLYDLHGLE